jgi:carbon-monoxide dehydrogenase medium subunit
MSLIPLMKLRLASPTVLVDIARLPQLRRVGREDDFLVVGAGVTHREAAGPGPVREHLGWVADAAAHIGDVQVRNVGTVGGSLAEADPAGDWAPVVLALEGTILCRGPAGERAIPAGEFFLGPYTTALRPDEVITALRFPLPGPGTAGAHLKLERRTGDFAVAIAHAVLAVDPEGFCRRVRIAVGAVEAVPKRVQAAEALLEGRRPTAELLRAAAEAARGAVVEPLSDVKASAEYRKDVVGTLVARAVAEAYRKITGTEVR